MFGDIIGMQEKMQAELAEVMLSESAVGGKLEITVSGDRAVQNVSIDDALLHPDSREELEDLLVITLNRALASADALAAQKTKEMMSGMLPPGMDLGSLF